MPLDCKRDIPESARQARTNQKKERLDTLTSYTKKIPRILWGVAKYAAMTWIGSLLI